MNPVDAESLGLRDRDDAILYNGGGELSVRVSVTGRVPAGTLWAPRPLTDERGRAQNALISPSAQGIGGGPLFNSTRVRVRKSS
jgi:anaerobic selenocysteine-containing dehydrogenase